MSDRANTKEYWDKMWSSPKRHYEKRAMNRALFWIDKTKPKSVLDIGCGNGRLLHSVNAQKRFGIDISEVGVNYMKNVFGIDGLAMDLYDLGNVDIGTYDFIVFNHTLEHIARDKFAVGLLKDKLNPGGYLFCAVPNNMSSPEETEEHCQMYDYKSLTDLMMGVFGNCKIEVIGNHLVAICQKQ